MAYLDSKTRLLKAVWDTGEESWGLEKLGARLFSEG